MNSNHIDQIQNIINRLQALYLKASRCDNITIPFVVGRTLTNNIGTKFRDSNILTDIHSSVLSLIEDNITIEAYSTYSPLCTEGTSSLTSGEVLRAACVESGAGTLFLPKPNVLNNDNWLIQTDKLITWLETVYGNTPCPPVYPDYFTEEPQECYFITGQENLDFSNAIYYAPDPSDPNYDRDFREWEGFVGSSPGTQCFSEDTRRWYYKQTGTSIGTNAGPWGQQDPQPYFGSPTWHCVYFPEVDGLFTETTKRIYSFSEVLIDGKLVEVEIHIPADPTTSILSFKTCGHHTLWEGCRKGSINGTYARSGGSSPTPDTMSVVKSDCPVLFSDWECPDFPDVLTIPPYYLSFGGGAYINQTNSVNLYKEEDVEGNLCRWVSSGYYDMEHPGNINWDNGSGMSGTGDGYGYVLGPSLDSEDCVWYLSAVPSEVGLSVLLCTKTPVIEGPTGSYEVYSPPTADTIQIT